MRHPHLRNPGLGASGTERWLLGDTHKQTSMQINTKCFLVYPRLLSKQIKHQVFAVDLPVQTGKYFFTLLQRRVLRVVSTPLALTQSLTTAVSSEPSPIWVQGSADTSPALESSGYCSRQSGGCFAVRMRFSRWSRARLREASLFLMLFAVILAQKHVKQHNSRTRNSTINTAMTRNSMIKTNQNVSCLSRRRIVSAIRVMFRSRSKAILEQNGSRDVERANGRQGAVFLCLMSLLLLLSWRLVDVTWNDWSYIL